MHIFASHGYYVNFVPYVLLADSLLKNQISYTIISLDNLQCIQLNYP